MRAWFGCVLTMAGVALGCDDASCPGASFPSAPSDASSTVFVSSACISDGEDGSREHPYTTLGAGIAHASPGATILVAYDTTYEETVTVDRPLAILAATEGFEAADVRSVLLPPSGAGIVVAPGVKGVLVRGLRIERAAHVGIWVPEGAQATLDRMFVYRTQADEEGQFGYGILASDGGSVEVTHSVVQGAPGAGIYVAEAEATIDQTTVLETKGHGGIRLENAKGTVTIRDSEVDDWVEVGILVSNSTASIKDTIIGRGTAATNGLGDGIVVRRRKNDAGEYFAEASATITSATLTDIPRVGVLFSEGAIGSLTDSTITHAAMGAGRGAGVWLQSGAGGEDGILIGGCTIESNGHVGVGVASGATARIVDNPLIGLTMAFPNVGSIVDIADAISVFGGARAMITNNAIVSNQRFGVILDGAAEGTSIQGNQITKSFFFGVVVQGWNETVPELWDNVFENNSKGDSNVVGPMEEPFYVRTDDFVTP